MMDSLKNHWIELVTIIIGSIILIVNNLVLKDVIPFLVPVVNVIGGLIASVPAVLIFYARYRTTREIEEQFISFLKDLEDSINSGMTLPLALSQCSKKDYLSLSKHVNDLASQIEWGVPFEKALENMSKKIPSLPVKRAIATIIETYKVGGKISDTLGSVNRSLVTIQKLKKERSSSVHSQIVTSYIIYFIFVFILVIMQSFLLPTITQQSITTALVQSPITGIQTTMYADVFITFIIIQGFFAGLASGKMAEGSLIAGLKHSVFLIIAGYAIFSLASQIKFSI